MRDTLVVNRTFTYDIHSAKMSIAMECIESMQEQDGRNTHCVIRTKSGETITCADQFEFLLKKWLEWQVR